VNRDSGTASANGGWLQRSVGRREFENVRRFGIQNVTPKTACCVKVARPFRSHAQ
jgi:hypothetical protein